MNIEQSTTAQPEQRFFRTNIDGQLLECDPPKAPDPNISIRILPPPSTRCTTDWKTQFKQDELVVGKDGNQTVRLRGLQRCAHLAGLVESFPVMSYIQVQGSHVIIQCVYHVRFNDGSHFGGAADVNNKNISDEYGKYPTAVAESRAESRALRKALGITDMLAYEEVDQDGILGQKDLSVSDKVERQQVDAINLMLTQLKIDALTIINEVLPTKRAKEINALQDLTVGEASKILEVLNQKRADLPSTPPVSSKKININKVGD